MSRTGPRYRRNRRLRHQGLGPRVFDDNSGIETFEELTVRDDYGAKVNPRFGTYDIDHTKEDRRT